jgi:hypothetical protein
MTNFDKFYKILKKNTIIVIYLTLIKKVLKIYQF